MHKKFSTEEAVKFGWEATKKNIGFFVVLLIVLWILMAITYRILPSPIVIFAVNMLIIMGLITIALRFADKKGVEFPDFYKKFKDVNTLANFLGAAVIYHVLVAVGLVLLIAPGIYFAITYKFYGYYIVDKKMSALDALKASAKLTEGIKWDLFWFNVVLFTILCIGMIFLMVGLLAAIPVVMVASAHVYRKLVGHHTGTAHHKKDGK